jgi:hypothetical protein
MHCYRCQGFLVVEPLPTALEGIAEYSTEKFGWLRCVNCGMGMDLTMYRTKQQASVMQQAEHCASVAQQEHRARTTEDVSLTLTGCSMVPV